MVRALSAVQFGKLATTDDWIFSAGHSPVFFDIFLILENVQKKIDSCRKIPAQISVNFPTAHNLCMYVRTWFLQVRENWKKSEFD